MNITVNGKTLNNQRSYLVAREIIRETEVEHPMDVEAFLKEYTIEECEKSIVLRPPTAEGIHISLLKPSK
ncbi:hypothetical protein QWY14_04520 [Planococcus sp. N028]|uniref:Uncharacterized protein n=1 Tax=Planococcus shixiaomingii TaxID=3058393 RepID=A0ABT8N0F5_9BACL|nr:MULTISPECIES: hypothetical protein [unclassified Planococcus (in: firmicutes)]MDN7241040.1 hypothetical protein [Planococcus sp. N028]WKA53294.1 hypothetical protein QWY21_11540 [Planococcus sp. N022]